MRTAAEAAQETATSAQGGNGASETAGGGATAGAGIGGPSGSDFWGVAGKIWNAPNTALGLAYGFVGGVIDRGLWLATLGYVDLGFSISIGNNAIQFQNHPLQQLFGSASESDGHRPRRQLGERGSPA